MKTTPILMLILSSAFFNVANAAQQVSNVSGKEKIGVVSASRALTLDELSAELNRKADKAGATAYRIISADGNNYLHGVAEIYK
ncbi:DUF1471 domain-containing protein [Raoultella sp. WB_B2P2-3]|uniref:DUF1471 domain-containing protein n=1 Tax=Raoultella scottii TaxID=3040937 RepID=A0ABU8YZZ2_9ENTR